MLGSQKLTAFIGVKDAAGAKAFYGDKLGLKLISEDSFALVFDVQGTTLRAALVEDVAPRPYTVLGWQVADIRATVQALGAEGIKLHRYGWFEQDELGIWTAPGGARVAWFSDPDGNVLSVSQS